MIRYCAIFLFTVLIGGCQAKDLAPPPQQEGGKTVQVSIVKFKFVPEDITINKGDTVIWINQESRQYHSVWFEQLGLAESDYLFPGESYSQKFDAEGIFPYRCGPHPEMLGTVRVK
ncbi:hypothetical protein MNBD_ALPHA01-888 [hydrothermal vent metagenome]|uniref:Blue (type 1) copper domain-containing protein n=1 Tax=hydrothermal vent metagenome TaxID=652676 RepID=A0A3B0SNJ8_9ZZZZ